MLGFRLQLDSSVLHIITAKYPGHSMSARLGEESSGNRGSVPAVKAVRDSIAAVPEFEDDMLAGLEDRHEIGLLLRVFVRET